MSDHVTNVLQKLLSSCEYEQYKKKAISNGSRLKGDGCVIEEQISFFPQIICLLANIVSALLFHLSCERTYRPESSGGIGTLHVEQD